MNRPLCALVVALLLSSLVACSAAQVPATNSLSSPVAVATTAPTNSLSAPVEMPTPQETPTPSGEPSPALAPTPIATTEPLTTPGVEPSLGPNGFPVEIDGLPVVSVAQAKQLRDAGQLDGRVVAIAAFFSYTIHSCPSFAWADGPLQSSPSCVGMGFADNEADARACHHIRNGMACQSSPLPIVPIGMPETTGSSVAGRDPDDFYKPNQIVVLAHSDDARQWQCSPTALAECKRALVADGFAWANGSTVTPEEPELWDLGGYHQIPLRMSLADVQAAIGDAQVITAAPFQAKDIWTIDPRWNLGGDEAVWLVRTLANDSESSDATRAATVSLVDDATGTILDSHDLALDPSYVTRPLWLNSERRDLDALGNVPDQLESYYRIRAEGGSVVNEHGPWTSVPVLLPAGTYTVETWLATSTDGVQGPPTRSCSTELQMNALDGVSLLAYYEPDKQCAWTTVAPPA